LKKRWFDITNHQVISVLQKALKILQKQQIFKLPCTFAPISDIHYHKMSRKQIFLVYFSKKKNCKTFGENCQNLMSQIIFTITVRFVSHVTDKF
jgi:hypothetical protein